MHPVVKTTAGEVRGEVVDVPATGGGAGARVRRFLGIPYAAAPFGPGRFRPPAPVPRWDGVRDAVEFGPTAPAPGYASPFDQLLPAPMVPGEECLNVNVWAPEDAAGLPVLVWIHGGAFVNGSNAIPTYDGAPFARDGVVLVTINYRLGAEGFLLLPDGTPNLGLLDQVAALRWVQENAAAFGGDAANVTVFGESAGAMSIGALLAMPVAQGLFRRAILESGAGHHALSTPTATRIAGYVAEELGVSVEGLADVSPERLLQAQQAVSAQVQAAPDPARWGEVAANSMIYEPVVDGDLLPGLPIERVAAGASADVDLLVGSNRDEHRFFLVPLGSTERATEATLALVAGAYGLPDGALDRYRAAQPDASPGMVLADVMSDWFFRIPAIRLAEAHGRAHVYEFDWGSPLFDGRMGACHALEIGFVFDTLDAAGGLTGDAPPQELAAAMHRAWVAFATTGDPGWERYGDERHVRRFGDNVETVQDPRGATRELWEGIR